jgi:hypothetical protein
VWDNDLVNLSFGRAVTNRTGLPPAALDKLAQAAQQVPATAQGGAALDWAKESNALARSVAYNFDGFACFEPVSDIVVLDQTYIQTAKTLIPKQIASAGARLARLLNAALGSGQ